jgi:hypothetical protein
LFLDFLGREMPCPGISGRGKKEGFGAREICKGKTYIYSKTKDLDGVLENSIFSLPSSQETGTRQMGRKKDMKTVNNTPPMVIDVPPGNADPGKTLSTEIFQEIETAN